MALTLPTGGRGQALALGMTVLTVAVLWAGVAGPLRDFHAERAEQLRRQEILANRMASLVETLPALRREAEERVHGGPGDVTGTITGGVNGDTTAALLPGASDSLAAASLQQRIDALALSAGVRISSQEILPSEAAGDLRTIPVRLTVTAPYPALVALLLDLARSDIPMIAGDIVLRGPTVTHRDSSQTVDASLTVTSFRAAKAEPR